MAIFKMHLLLTFKFLRVTLGNVGKVWVQFQGLFCQFVILSYFCLVVFPCSWFSLVWVILALCWRFSAELGWSILMSPSQPILPIISATDRSISHTQQDLFWQNSIQRFWGRFCFYHSHLTDCWEKFCWWLMNPEIDEHKYARYPPTLS